MAQGQWVNIPGKGRRWQQPSGELMMEKPGFGFVQAQLSPFTNFLGGIFKSSGLPAYQMSGPGLQQLRQQQTQDYYRQRGLSNLGADYKEQELAAGVAAERFRPGAGFPGQQAAADRAYESEKSRVAQLTAQDPELQRYEAARKLAVAPGATPEQVQSAEDIGMQMWAKANPKLAAKVKPGQSGYEAIQGTLAGNMARAGQGFGMTEQLVPTPQGFPTQVPGLPTGAGYSTGFGVTANLAPGAQTPPPYSTIKPTSELSGLGAAPLGTAATSTFGQPNVMDAAKFEELLKLIKK